MMWLNIYLLSYIYLDPPTHLHPLKADKELETLRELRDKGNIGRSQQVSALKQQLSDAREAQERIGRQLKDYRAKVYI